MEAVLLTVVDDSATEINKLHQDNCKAAEQTIESAIRIGELLSLERAKRKHGEWLPWLKTNIQFSHDTAKRYQLIFKQRDKLRTVRNLNEAYRIALPKGKRKRAAKKAKETKPLSAEEATATWLTFFESLPENQRPAVARAAFGWTKHNHELLGNIDIKYGQTRTLKMNL